MAFTAGEWQNWFCSFLGVPLPSMLTLIANNQKCPCGRPYDAHAHHVHTCIQCHKTRAHNLVQDCLISLASDTDFGATKRVPTIEVDDQPMDVAEYFPQKLGAHDGEQIKNTGRILSVLAKRQRYIGAIFRQDRVSNFKQLSNARRDLNSVTESSSVSSPNFTK